MPKKRYIPDDGSTVSIDFDCIAIANRDRVRKYGQTYTNLHCPACGEWHILIAIGKRKKVHCPWCGKKLKIKLMR